MPEERDGLRVTVAVLNREEARQAFGVNLQNRNIQPVWIEIENNTDEAFWFMLHGLDPNYFSAHEAAYMNHFRFGGETNRQMDDYFADLGIDQAIDPEVDEARNYLGEDLATATALDTYGSIEGVGKVTRDAPKQNLLGSPWWTDGRRLVLVLSANPVALDELELLEWSRESMRMRNIESASRESEPNVSPPEAATDAAPPP